MADKRSFTGTARKRQTSWSVAAGDRVAKAFITVGGVGTIVAVLLVLAYLVSVVLPLFLPPESTKLAGMSAASFAIDGQEGTFGFRDGTIRTGRIGFATTFLEPAIVKAPLAGTVAHVAVTPRDLVKRGQALITIEAKKSKTVVSAEIDGRVAADGLVRVGTAVEEGK